MWFRCSALLVALALAAIASAQPAGRIPVEFPTFGLTLAPPEGFARAPETAPEQVARWVRSGRDGRTAQAVLTVEVVPRQGRTLAGFAEQTGARNIASVARHGAALDGAEALRLVSDFTGARPHARGALIAQRDERFYIVSLWGEPSIDPAPIFETVRASWRWRRVEPAARHLALAEAPVTLPGQRLRVRLPAIARPSGEPASEALAAWTVRDLGAGRDELAIQFTQTARDPRASDAQVREAFFASVQQSLGLRAAPPTRPVPGKDEAWASDWIELPDAERAGAAAERAAAPRLVRYVLWSHAPGRVVLCQFMLHPGGAEHRARYAALADQIVASLEPATP